MSTNFFERGLEVAKAVCRIKTLGMPASPPKARVFQRPIALIEDLTGLNFGGLRNKDRMGSVDTTSTASARPIRGAEDIMF